MMWPFTRRRRARFDGTLDAAMAVLRSMGIGLRTSASIDDIRFSLEGSTNAAVDPVVLLTIIGGEGERAPFNPLSDDIWHCDAECIEDHGAYVALAQRFSDLARGSLRFDGMKDFVDIDGGTAWFSYQEKGRDIRWDLAVNDDWMDPAFYAHMQTAIRQAGDRRFMICMLGQDQLIACGTEALRLGLSDFTGLDFRWS